MPPVQFSKRHKLFALSITATASVFLATLDFDIQFPQGLTWAVVFCLVAVLIINLILDVSSPTETFCFRAESSIRKPWLPHVMTMSFLVAWLVFAVGTKSFIVCATLPLVILYSWYSFRNRHNDAANAAQHASVAIVVLSLFLLKAWFFATISSPVTIAVWQIFTSVFHTLGDVSLSVEGQQLVVSGQLIHVSHFIPFEGLVLTTAIWLFSGQPKFKSATHWLAAVVALFSLHAVWTVLLTNWGLQGQLGETSMILVDIGLVLSLLFLMSRDFLRLAPEFHSINLLFGWSAVGFLIAVFVVNTDSRARQSGIVWIDQGHGNWETIGPPPDTISYGRNTMYTYSWLYQWLDRHYDVRVLDSRIPDLQETGILIVKMPVVPFEESEKRSIEQFVRRGGTVLAIGDHTNLFGTSDVLNDLLIPYGGRFNPDAVIPTQGTEYRYAPRWWNRTPVVAGLDFIDFQTSCSIGTSTLLKVPLIVATGVVAEAADYSNDRFFGKLTVTPEDQRSPLQLCVSLKHGKGKVLLFGDSTIWSSFSFFSPNNKELLDNLIQYGLQPKSFAYSAWFWATLVLVVAGIARSANKSWMGIGVRMMVFLVVARSAVASLESGYISRVEKPSVYVESVHSTIDVTTDIRTGRIDDINNYSHFCASMTRRGLWPEVSDEVWEDPNVPVLILNPNRDFTSSDLTTVERYVRQGGSLLVMDDALHIEHSTSSTLLNHFGIRTKLEQTSGSIATPEGSALADFVFGLPLSMIYEPRRRPGGNQRKSAVLRLALIDTEPLLVTGDGTCVFGLKQVGLGKVLVFTESALFSRQVFGDVWGGVQPGGLRYSLYRLLYSVLGEWACQTDSSSSFGSQN